MATLVCARIDGRIRLSQGEYREVISSSCMQPHSRSYRERERSALTRGAKATIGPFDK